MTLEAIERFLIVGLGNPGREYRESRHNVGFMLVDCLAERFKVAFSRLEQRALVTKADQQGRQIILAKPQTFMNLSGVSTGALMRYYKIPITQLMVAYDDVDLPLGPLRLRPDGGSAGHKGMTSIIKRLGTQEFPRMRIGIGRPPGRKEAADYVLQNFSTFEVETLTPTLERAAVAALLFITQGLEAAMNQYNGIG